MTEHTMSNADLAAPNGLKGAVGSHMDEWKVSETSFGLGMTEMLAKTAIRAKLR